MEGKTIRITKSQLSEITALSALLGIKEGALIRHAIGRGLPLVRIEAGPGPGQLGESPLAEYIRAAENLLGATEKIKAQQ
jgi:hypothetical protein